MNTSKRRIIRGQSRVASLIEAIVNIVVGASVAYASQVIIFGLYNIHVSWKLNLEMTGWFTAVSIARSFLLRRLFNWFTIRNGSRRPS